MRLEYISHRPINADQAVVGLMAEGILHGHFTTFYWGQYYGGTLEALVVAGVFKILGQSATVLTVLPAIEAAVAALLTWRIALRLVDSRWVAALAGVTVWLAPQSAVSNSTYEWDFRGIALACGLLALLAAVRLGSGRTVFNSAVLGLSLGVGWWTSPEIVYFALPSVLIGAVYCYGQAKQDRLREVALTAGVTAVGFLVGASPWIRDNIHTHLASLRASVTLPPHAPGYFGRLDLFVKYSLGILFSLRDAASWIGGPTLGISLLVVVLALLLVAVIACLMRNTITRILAISLLAFPFLMAVSPFGWYWQDGRYVGFVVPLLVLVFAAGYEEFAQVWLPWIRTKLSATRSVDQSSYKWAGSTLFAGIAIVLIVLSLVNYQYRVKPVVARAHPNAGVVDEANLLEAAGVQYGYAGYWVAYELDFFSHQRLDIASLAPDRDVAQLRRVSAKGHVPWLFVAAGQSFPGAPPAEGPGENTESNLLSQLRARGEGFSVKRIGLLDAVTPDS
jgi:hypothetical protein